MSRHKTCYVISYHGILCHDMSYVTTITASLVGSIHYLLLCIFRAGEIAVPSISSFNPGIQLAWGNVSGDDKHSPLYQGIV